MGAGGAEPTRRGWQWPFIIGGIRPSLSSPPRARLPGTSGAAGGGGGGGGGVLLPPPPPPAKLSSPTGSPRRRMSRQQGTYSGRPGSALSRQTRHSRPSSPSSASSLTSASRRGGGVAGTRGAAIARGAELRSGAPWAVFGVGAGERQSRKTLGRRHSRSVQRNQSRLYRNLKLIPLVGRPAQIGNRRRSVVA